MTRVLLVVVFHLACGQMATAEVKFGDWIFDQKNDRWVCKYTYKNKMGGNSTQLMVWYPNHPDRKRYYFFSTSDHKKYWGRCLSPEHPNFDKDKMQWAKLKDDRWQNLPKGDCPAPGDSADPDADAIGKLPPPPP